MTDQPLSPAAQAVLDAFENASDGEFAVFRLNCPSRPVLTSRAPQEKEVMNTLMAIVS